MVESLEVAGISRRIEIESIRVRAKHHELWKFLYAEVDAKISSFLCRAVYLCNTEVQVTIALVVVVGSEFNQIWLDIDAMGAFGHAEHQEPVSHGASLGVGEDTSWMHNGSSGVNHLWKEQFSCHVDWEVAFKGHPVVTKHDAGIWGRLFADLVTDFAFKVLMALDRSNEEND